VEAQSGSALSVGGVQLVHGARTKASRLGPTLRIDPTTIIRFCRESRGHAIEMCAVIDASIQWRDVLEARTGGCTRSRWRGLRCGRRALANSRALAELGCWSHLSPTAAAECERSVAAGGYPFTAEVFSGVDFMADGEELAEGGVEDLLQLMDPALRGHGVALRVEALHLPNSADDEYMVDINGRRCVVLDRDDCQWAYRRVIPRLTVASHARH
jgi:hypothetical protein